MKSPTYLSEHDELTKSRFYRLAGPIHTLNHQINPSNAVRTESKQWLLVPQPSSATMFMRNVSPFIDVLDAVYPRWFSDEEW